MMIVSDVLCDFEHLFLCLSFATMNFIYDNSVCNVNFNILSYKILGNMDPWNSIDINVTTRIAISSYLT